MQLPSVLPNTILLLTCFGRRSEFGCDRTKVGYDSRGVCKVQCKVARKTSRENDRQPANLARNPRYATAPPDLSFERN